MSKKNKGNRPPQIFEERDEPEIKQDATQANESEPEPIFHAQALPVKSFPNYRVIIHSLNVRDIPSKSGRIIEQIEQGAEVSGRSFEEGDWVKVRTDSGAEGYCMRVYLSEAVQ